MSDKSTRNGSGLVYMLFCLATSMIGYHIHHSIFWSVLDWIFAPFAWCKWLILQEVNLTIIRDTFAFFLK
jgi:hypothetical protein